MNVDTQSTQTAHRETERERERESLLYHMLKDSPHPQLPFEFGLVKTNSDRSLSVTKSICVPMMCIRHFPSTSIRTPYASTSSSNFPFSSGVRRRGTCNRAHAWPMHSM